MAVLSRQNAMSLFDIRWHASPIISVDLKSEGRDVLFNRSCKDLVRKSYCIHIVHI